MSDWDETYKNRLQRREEIQAWHAEQQRIHDGLTAPAPVVVEAQPVDPEPLVEERVPEPTPVEEVAEVVVPDEEESAPAEEVVEESKPVAKKAAAKKATTTED